MVGVGIAFWTCRTDYTGWYLDLEDRKYQRDSAAQLSLIKDDIDPICRGKDLGHSSPWTWNMLITSLSAHQTNALKAHGCSVPPVDW